jgi:hypothetical protein
MNMVFRISAYYFLDTGLVQRCLISGDEALTREPGDE